MFPFDTSLLPRCIFFRSILSRKAWKSFHIAFTFLGHVCCTVIAVYQRLAMVLQVTLSLLKAEINRGNPIFVSWNTFSGRNLLTYIINHYLLTMNNQSLLRFSVYSCKVMKNAVILPHNCDKSNQWTRSSMDRIKDSGSFDWGSTPHGFTIFCYKYLIISI